MKKYIYARATACGMSGRETVTSPARPYQKKKDIPVGLYISTANLHRKVDKIFELYLLILLTRRNYYGIIFLTVTVFQDERKCLISFLTINVKFSSAWLQDKFLLMVR